MALKPPPIGDVLQQVNEVINGSGELREEVDRRARSVAQAALARLDVVNRAEFDAQVAALERLQARVQRLEGEVVRLGERVDALAEGGQHPHGGST